MDQGEGKRAGVQTPGGLIHPKYALRGRGSYQADFNQPTEQRGEVYQRRVCDPLCSVRTTGD